MQKMEEILIKCNYPKKLIEKLRKEVEKEDGE